MTNQPATHYIIQTASAQMPQSCKGRYKRIAIMEVDSDLDRVSMISLRAKGCHSIPHVWEKLHVGSTERCAFQVAMAEAIELCAEMNRFAS